MYVCYLCFCCVHGWAFVCTSRVVEMHFSTVLIRACVVTLGEHTIRYTQKVPA